MKANNGRLCTFLKAKISEVWLDNFISVVLCPRFIRVTVVLYCSSVVFHCYKPWCRSARESYHGNGWEPAEVLDWLKLRFGEISTNQTPRFVRSRSVGWHPLLVRVGYLSPGHHMCGFKTGDSYDYGISFRNRLHVHTSTDLHVFKKDKNKE
ncbi:hypothetical protein V1264_002661 [Littorina saxatilis]|uniref:Uncharacterized protein n=1 Tax=Littorina saxatilis TaxID=31220 RepID=A0AAN9B3V5_9CAEN